MPEQALSDHLRRLAPDIDADEDWTALRRRMVRRRRRRALLAGTGVLAAGGLVAALAVVLPGDDPDETVVATAPPDGDAAPADPSACDPGHGFPLNDSSPADAPFGLSLDVAAAEPGDLVDVQLVLSPVLRPEPTWGDDWLLQRRDGEGWTTTHYLLGTVSGPASWVAFRGSAAFNDVGFRGEKGQIVVPPVEPGPHRIVADASNFIAESD